MADLAGQIEALWEGRDQLATDDEAARALVHEAIDLLDRGEVRVAELVDDQVVVHEWLKLAILLLFRLSQMETVELGPFEYADKIPLKRGYQAAGVRVVPGASARWGAHLEPGVIMMPSYVNIGARVGSGTMVDTWATVGSCAQIGRNVHLSGGVGIGGVLEPPERGPGDGGRRVPDRQPVHRRRRRRVGEGSSRGRVHPHGVDPAHRVLERQRARPGCGATWTVAVAASRSRTFPGGHEFGLPCVLLIKQLDEGRRHDKLAQRRPT